MLRAMLIRAATSDDLAALEQLLAADELPTSDLDHQLANFLALCENELDPPIGFIGLEVCGESYGLLRSLVVRNSHRSRGLAGRLCEELFRLARQRGVEQLYLLTTTAEGFFRKIGFRTVPRESAPAPVQQTEEFRSLCPSSAVCMHYTL